MLFIKFFFFNSLFLGEQCVEIFDLILCKIKWEETLNILCAFYYFAEIKVFRN